MNIYTVRDNLKNTISGKQMLLATYENPLIKSYPDVVRYTMIEYLNSNITELTNILKDIELCCTQATEQSWQINPEQMGR